VNVDWDAWNVGDRPKYPHEKVVQWVFRNFPPELRTAMRALDLGCGSGVHTVFLAQEGFAVTATDLSPIGIQNTRRRLNDLGLSGDLIVSGAADLRLPRSSFDLAICVGALECMGPSVATKAVKKVAGALREDGKALFIFAGDRDFRVTGENPWRLHGFSRAEVDELFTGRFPRIWVDRSITTYEGGTVEQNDWLVTVSV